MKSFTCKDAGVQCDWSTKGESDEAIMKDVSAHAEEKHGIKNMTHDLVEKVKGAIHDIKDDRSRSSDKSQVA